MDIDTTKSDCPVCGQAVPASMFEKGGDLWMRKECPEHGASETLFWKDASLFQRFAPAGDERLPEGRLDLLAGDADGFLTTLAVDVTTRCNMACPTCVSAIGATPASDPPIDELLSWIPDFTTRPGKFKPNISLIGGESSLREDLPDIIRAVIAKGLVPRLNSNGLRLRDPERVERLWEAGLRWVILQFDGFTAESSLAFRGKDYRDAKREVIEQLAARGFAIHLAVMVENGVNDHEIGEIIRFATRHPRILRVSFYPRSHIGRVDHPANGATHVADFMGAVERTTGRELTAQDFVEARQTGRHLFRLTGHPMFRTRRCIFPILVMRHRGRLLPVSRLFRPMGLLRNPGAALRLLANAGRLMRYDEARFAPEFLFLNLEKFYDRHAFDLQAAHNCHHVYLSDKGAIPFCVYNTFHREKREPARARVAEPVAHPVTLIEAP